MPDQRSVFCSHYICSDCFRDGHVALSEPVGHKETILGVLAEKHTPLCVGVDTQRFPSGKGGSYCIRKWSLRLRAMCRTAEPGEGKLPGTGDFL